MPRIFIDAQCLVKERSGMGWAAKYMIESLALIDKKNSYTLYYFGGKNIVSDLSDLKLGKNFKIKECPISRRVIDMLFKKGLLPKAKFFLGKYDLKVRHLGYVKQSDLPLIYNLAKVFIYPSWYEGFGLPILEAQACGICLITSNTGCCLEVAQDSAILVDPSSSKSISEGMLLSLQDEVDKKYQKLGLENIKRFSWKKSGRELLNVMNESINKIYY